MWIISKLSGVINADQVSRFTESPSGTNAHFKNFVFTISDKPVLATIIDALKNGDNFLEVE